MKPKPFASLNHFTDPFATSTTPSAIRDFRPPPPPPRGRPARPLWSDLRTTFGPDTKNAAGGRTPAALKTPSCFVQPSGDAQEFLPFGAECKAEYWMGRARKL